MKILKKMALGLTLASLAAAPVVAQEGAESSQTDDGWLAEGGFTQLAVLLSVVAAIVIGLELFDDNDNPVSS